VLLLVSALASAADLPPQPPPIGVAAPAIALAPAWVPPGAPDAKYPAPLVTAARRHLGWPYRWAGRADTLDCMGLVFVAWTDVTGQPWEQLSDNPTELVAAHALGAPVPGLDGVLTDDIDWSLLHSGDVVFFIGLLPNPVEPSIATIGGDAYWVRHMGIYSGDLLRRFLNGDPGLGRVAELSLPDYLAVWHVWYQGIYVVRPGT
jgi:cell wall-associated NlpC family hydrolase